MGVPIIAVIVFGGLDWGPLILRNYMYRIRHGLQRALSAESGIDSVLS